MELIKIKSNMNELRTDHYRILVSYATPVAVIITSPHSPRIIGLPYRIHVTDKKWSSTTTRHINQWLQTYNITGKPTTKPQSYFDNLYSSM